MIHRIPSAPIVANHTTMIGPEQRARPRPCRGTESGTAPTRMATVVGTTYGSKMCVATVEPFDGAEHRNRRRDHAVAVEQRGAEQAERDQKSRGFAACACGWRDTSAISARMPPSPSLSARMTKIRYLTEMIERQRPEDQRQHAKHVLARGRDAVGTVEAFTQRVERTGTDVAVDDAKGSQSEKSEIPPGRGRGRRLGRA